MTSTTERRRTTTVMNEGSIDYSTTVQMAAAYLLRYGFVLVIAWIGFMKFTAFEAAGIQPLVSHSPLMRWVYDIFSERAFSALLGVVEIAIAAMIALRPVSAIIAVYYSPLRHEALERSTLWLTCKEDSHAEAQMGCEDHSRDRARRPEGQARR